jgi:hypothetical protein
MHGIIVWLLEVWRNNLVTCLLGLLWLFWPESVLMPVHSLVRSKVGLQPCRSTGYYVDIVQIDSIVLTIIKLCISILDDYLYFISRNATYLLSFKCDTRDTM